MAMDLRTRTMVRSTPRTVTVSALVGVAPDSRSGWTPSLRSHLPRVGPEDELARRVRRLRRALARLGYALHRRGEGYMVADAESRAVLAGGSPSAYGLSLDGAEDCLEEARAQG